MISLYPETELCFGEHGGAECFLHDIDGDGRREVVTYQGPGIFGAGNLQRGPGLEFIEAFYPSSVSVSAFRLDGTRLWTWGTPNPPDRPYVSHSSESVIACADLDGDGAVEVAVADGNRVVVLDGKTGIPRGTAALPADNFYIVQALGAPTAPHEAALVVKNGEIGYGTYTYGEPVLGLNADLQIVWGPLACPGGGHHVAVLGRPAHNGRYYLNGYTALAPDGTTRWTVEGIDPDTLDTASRHVDYIDVRRQPDRAELVALAGSDRVYLLEEGGTVLFAQPGPHVQGVAFGQFRSSADCDLAVYNSPNGPLQLYDLAGRKLWDRMPSRTWPLGEPESCRGGRFHRNRPIVALPGDRDWIGYADGGWPWGMDGNGEVSLQFHPPQNSRQPEAGVALPPGKRRDDFGYGYALQVCDMNGDGKPAAVIHDRRFLWVYPLNG